MAEIKNPIISDRVENIFYKLFTIPFRKGRENNNGYALKIS